MIAMASHANCPNSEQNRDSPVKEVCPSLFGSFNDYKGLIGYTRIRCDELVMHFDIGYKMNPIEIQ
jgi:hypothetical protein